jgi:xanthine dehydrogenase molybdopterin-binding subunit B
MPFLLQMYCVQVAQVIARELGISMDLIKLKSSSALTSPNNSTTGGSMGSEMNCFVSIFSLLNSAFNIKCTSSLMPS